MGGHDSNLCLFLSRSAPRSQWSIPLCLIDGRRGPPLSPQIDRFAGAPKRLGIGSGLARGFLGSRFSVLGFRCHVELDAETVRFDFVSITCRLRLVYVSFTCFTAECQLIYLFRAPHLLRILATGNSTCYPINGGPFESTVAPCRTYWLPFPETFLQKGYALLFIRHKRCLHAIMSTPSAG